MGAFCWGRVPRALIAPALVLHLGTPCFEVTRESRHTGGAPVGARPQAESFVDSITWHRYCCHPHFTDEGARLEVHNSVVVTSWCLVEL